VECRFKNELSLYFHTNRSVPTRSGLGIKVPQIKKSSCCEVDVQCLEYGIHGIVSSVFMSLDQCSGLNIS